MENQTPRYVDINNFIRLCNLWIGQLQRPEDAGDLNGVQTCLDVILDEPIADVAPVVHGWWNGQRCSICDGSYMDYADADSYPAMGEPKPNYCPNCGAKMDLEVK